MGYLRPVSEFNKGKKSEFYARQYFTEAKAVEGCGCQPTSTLRPNSLSEPAAMVNPVKIGGVETFSTVDFPDKIAAVVFMPGLSVAVSVLSQRVFAGRLGGGQLRLGKVCRISENPARHFDGVVFSGGEPLMQNGSGGTPSPK